MLTAKVMLLGEMGVGKTSLAQRFVFDRFQSDYKTTIGVELFTHDVTVTDAQPESQVRLVLWDTDGDFGQRIFTTVYVSGAAGAIVVGDASRPPTLARMVDLAQGFAERFPGRPVKAIVNKIDLVEGGAAQVTLPQLPRDDVVFASAKTGTGVAEAFHALATTLLRRA